MKPAPLPTILYLAENFPFDISGGSEQRIAATILTLTQTARVHLLCFHLVEISTATQTKKIQAFADQVPAKFRSNFIHRLTWTVVCEPTIHQPLNWRQWLSEFWSKTPFLVWQYPGDNFRAQLDQLLHRLKPNYVHVCHLRMAGFLPDWLTSTRPNLELQKPKLVYESENVEWLLAQSQAKYLSRLGRWHWWWQREAELILKFETTAMSWFDYVFTLSQADTKHLKTLGAKKVSVLPILYPATLNPQLPKLPTPPTQNQGLNLVFVGNLNWLPNADAMKWFLTKIWPNLVQADPRIKLTIVGQPCEFFDLKPKIASERVTFTGFAEQLEPILAKNQISILPFRMGSGVRFKALTAAWAGHTIISTPLGIQGLGLTHGISCLVGTTAAEFTNLILQLAKHPAQIQVLGKNAQTYLSLHHGWDSYQHFWPTYLKIGT